MYYIAIQNADSNVWIGERFACFEADSQEEANERAEWYGIDFNERFGRYQSHTWEWHRTSCGIRIPAINSTPLEECPHVYTGAYVIVYKNGNLKSSLAIPLNREPDHEDSNDPVEAT
jgi:hypothetical protein